MFIFLLSRQHENLAAGNDEVVPHLEGLRLHSVKEIRMVAALAQLHQHVVQATLAAVRENLSIPKKQQQKKKKHDEKALGERNKGVVGG